MQGRSASTQHRRRPCRRRGERQRREAWSSAAAGGGVDGGGGGETLGFVECGRRGMGGIRGELRCEFFSYQAGRAQWHFGRNSVQLRGQGVISVRF